MLDTIRVLFFQLFLIILAIFVFYYNFLKKGKPSILIPSRCSIESEMVLVDFGEQEMMFKLTFPLTFINKGGKIVVIERIYATINGDIDGEWRTQRKDFFKDKDEFALPFSIEKNSSILKICNFHFDRVPQKENNIIHIIAVYDQNKEVIIKFRLICDEEIKFAESYFFVNTQRKRPIKQIKNVKSPIYRKSK